MYSLASGWPRISKLTGQKAHRTAGFAWDAGGNGTTMKRRAKTRLRVAAAILLPALIAGGVAGYRAVRVLGGHVAKVVCSAVFLSGREPGQVMGEELAQYGFMSTHVDRETASVSASLFGLAGRQAIFRPGLGCTLVIGTTGAALRAQVPGLARPEPRVAGIWPDGDVTRDGVWPGNVDREKLDEAVDRAFQEAVPGMDRRTRAIVVLYDGEIIAERYAPGITRETRLAGWSMTKSVTGALVGILVGDGRLDLEQSAPVPEWSDSDDPRHAITLDQMLRMSSGLKFDEDYEDPFSDVLQMLYGEADPARYAARLTLVTTPGEAWSYSSGTTNIISRIIRDAVGGSLTDYLTFPRRALFDRIGMKSAVMEPSASGNLVGSSFMYATARDWARFGLLYLQDGVWAGERILPAGWVDYARTPTPGAPRGEYGAQWWLNAGAKEDPADRWFPDVPRDAYFCQGFEGQFVTVIPSRKLVIVRLGASVPFEAWDHNAFVAGVVAAVN